MIETVVDVGPIRILQAIFESFPGGLWGVLWRLIAHSCRLEEHASFALDTEVLAQLSEPTEDRAVAWEGSKADVIVWLLESQDA